MGGDAVLKQKGRKHFSELGRKSGEARRAKAAGASSTVKATASRAKK